MWILLALLTALLSGLQETWIKLATRDVDAFALASLLGLGTATVLLPGLLLVGEVEVRSGFWLALAISGSLNAVAAVLTAQAMQRSDLSLVSPLKSFTPLFMVPLSAVILAERPSLLGLVGVATIVAGSYALNLRERKRGLLAPLRMLLADSGARLMLMVAFVFGIAATYDKVGVEASSPLLWGCALSATYGLLLLPLVVLRARGRAAPGKARIGRRGWGLLALAAVTTATMTFCQMTALTLTLAAYVIAVKRMSIVVSVLIGGIALRETQFRSRLTGATIMLVGFVLVTLG